MAIRDVVSRGFGNGTFNSSIDFAVTGGFAISEMLLTADSIFSVFGIIQERGKGVMSEINANGQGSLAIMIDSFAVSSTIQDRGKGLTGTINPDGQGVNGGI